LDELKDVGFLYVKMLYPFPSDIVREYLKDRKTLFIENNYMGQLALITRMFAGVEPTAVAIKFNGRPITTDDVVAAYRRFETGENVIKIESDL
ncbi:MAG: 2-oxoacid:ferredoxin oxidoreductase subunit alpha, partial [Pyrobaculum sp.]